MHSADVWSDSLPAVAHLSLELYSDDSIKCGACTFLVHRGGLEVTTHVIVSPELALREPESWLGSFAERAPGVEIGFRPHGDQQGQWHWQGSEESRGRGGFSVMFRGGWGGTRGGRQEWQIVPVPLDSGLEMACRWRPKGIESEWIPVDMAALREATDRLERFSRFSSGD